MSGQKKRSGDQPSGHQDRRDCDPRNAAADYARKNEEIRFAIEAMRRSQLVQEQRVSHLLKHEPYYTVDDGVL